MLMQEETAKGCKKELTQAPEAGSHDCLLTLREIYMDPFLCRRSELGQCTGCAPAYLDLISSHEAELHDATACAMCRALALAGECADRTSCTRLSARTSACFEVAVPAMEALKVVQQCVHGFQAKPRVATMESQIHPSSPILLELLPQVSNSNCRFLMSGSLGHWSEA